MKIKIFSFNMRMDEPKDGINYLPNRFERIKELIESEAPDIIGFQETREMAREWLCENLKDYTVLGCGRYRAFRGEGVTMAFKSSLFDLVSFETEWLSLEPAVPASMYGGDQCCPRVLQTAHLVPRDGSEPFVFANVHLDHKGEDAKKFGAMQTMQKLLSKPYKFILTGDFNSLPEEGVVTFIKDCKARSIKDITAELGGTFHNYGKAEKLEKIDYIFTDHEKYENVRLIEDNHPGGIYYTDHYIVSADIEI